MVKENFTHVGVVHDHFMDSHVIISLLRCLGAILQFMETNFEIYGDLSKFMGIYGNLWGFMGIIYNFTCKIVTFLL